MPALTLPTSLSISEDGLVSEAQPSSPPGPPYSPITPVMSASLPATNNPPTATGSSMHSSTHASRPQNQAAFTQTGRPSIDRATVPQEQVYPPPPPPEPISMSDNPDAIALRAAMSILQIQRQQALRDMKQLETQKEKALEDPEVFARAVSEGKIKARNMSGIVPLADEQDGVEGDDEDVDTENEDMENEVPDSKTNDLFGTIPSAQNVVRMPPVNWTKYHIVGESLDKLHNEQRARPSPGQPLRDEDLKPRERAPESVIAAPYNPWTDKVGEKPTRTRNGAKRKS